MDGVFPSRYSYRAFPAGETDNFPQSPKMPWTIEQQLHAYALNPQRTERHEILWTSWVQDRRWLSQLLEYTVFSAPMYSRHNASHCEAVIHNIECLLGEEEIRRLSATDCFAILVAVYLHDIGMVTISSERQNAVKSDGFSRFVQQLRTSPDTSMRWAAETFDRLSRQEAGSEAPGAYGEYQYDIYRAVVLLLAEFQRRQHADASADRVEQWIRDPAKLQSGLLMTGIPIRIFLQIAACARAHGESDFDTLLETLPKCDDGFTQDTYHPMFIAVLLALGDILDLDNERFNPFTRDVVGDDLFPSASQIHYRKHQAIRSLHISPKRIRITADCSNTDELRLLCQDMDWLEGFLKNCSYHWASIAPDNFCGCLPVVELAQVSLDGARIPSNLVTTKFELSQKKAFHLLSGANLYARTFPFLRELLQNAIDAVKLQYWTDYSASEFGKEEKLGLCEANRQQPLRKYPIHVDMAVKKRRRNSSGELLDVLEDDFKLPLGQLLRDYEFGVEVKVQDCGVGISEEDIQQISKVGSSHERRQEEISRMPEWLRPTGHFGIGLQSLFLVDDHFKCTTRTRRGECYEMTFHSGDRSEGYINIIPSRKQNSNLSDIPYGTCFSVFVPEHCKISHDKDMTGWLGMDPYQKDYGKYRKLRRSIELMVQLEEDFTSLVGEYLFPIILREQKLDRSLNGASALRGKLRERNSRSARGHRLVWQTIPAGTRYLERNEQNEVRCWLFQKQEEKLPAYQFGCLNDGSAYYFDVEYGRLYGWSQHAESFFCCSAHRLLDRDSENEEDLQRLHRVHLFVKGLFLTEIPCVQNDLLEYVDIKNDKLQDHLQMNRDGLTAQGVQKLNDEIIPQIQHTFDLILQHIDEVNLEIMKENRRDCLWGFGKACELVLKHRAEDDGHLPDADKFEKKFKKRLESMPVTAFSRFSLLPLKGKRENKDKREHEIFLEHREWENFWLDVFHALIKDLPENRGQYWKNGRPNTRVGVVGHLRTAFENEVNLERDLCSELQEQLFCRLDETLEKAQEQKNKIVDKESLDQFRDQLAEVHQIAFLCALCFFYANSCRPVSSNSCAKDQEPCSWEHLNREISRLLQYENDVIILEGGVSSQFTSLWKQMLFFPCIKEGQMGSVRQDTTITDVMLRGQHYAVFSTRSSRQGHWKHMLVHLFPFSTAERMVQKPGATIAEVLCWRPEKASECRRRENLLEKWHKGIIEEIVNTYFSWSSTASVSSSSNLWENPITRWMVRNLPSLSVGSDVDGNSRINVLTFQTPSQVFFNTCMINLLADRMRSTYETHNAQRIRTTTWDGLARLNCGDSITTNILRVDRGKVSEANRQHSMLVAFPSELPAVNIQLPDGRTLEEDSIHTTYDLLERVKGIYTQDGDLCGFTYARDVLECAQSIAKFLTLNVGGAQKEPSRPGSSQSDEGVETPSPGRRKLLSILQEKFRNREKDSLRSDVLHSEEDQVYAQERQRRREEIFLTEDINRLNGSLETLYWSYFADLDGRWQAEKRVPEVPSTWSKVDLPDDPDQYLDSLLIYLYDFDLAEAGEWPELKGFDLYKTTDELCDDIQKVHWAACYLFQYAGQQYQDEFLENICRWWMDEVWANDPGQETFMAYSKEHLSIRLERPELLDLYKEQIRMLIRAQIAPLNSPIDSVLADVDTFRALYQSHED